MKLFTEAEAVALALAGYAEGMSLIGHVSELLDDELRNACVAAKIEEAFREAAQAGLPRAPGKPQEAP